MNNTQVVITVTYCVLVSLVGVITAVILRSTRGRSAQEKVDTGRLAHMEGRWGAVVVLALGARASDHITPRIRKRGAADRRPAGVHPDVGAARSSPQGVRDIGPEQLDRAAIQHARGPASSGR